MAAAGQVCCTAAAGETGSRNPRLTATRGFGSRLDARFLVPRKSPPPFAVGRLACRRSGGLWDWPRRLPKRLRHRMVPPPRALHLWKSQRIPLREPQAPVHPAAMIRCFHKPVIIQPRRIDRDRVVSTVREAAEILLRDWPQDGAKRTRAMKACLDVLKARSLPAPPQRRFVAAAKDARIYLGEMER
jgi:hypothetical protein